MSVFWLAQIIGVIGYGILSVSPRCNRQRHVIVLGAIGSCFLCFQWYLMDAPTLMMVNIMVIAVSALAVLGRQYASVTRLYPYLYPVGMMALLTVSDISYATAMALAAFISLSASRTSHGTAAFRGWGVAAGGLMCFASLMAGGVAAAVFNLYFAYGHFVKLRSFHEEQRGILAYAQS